MYLMIFLGGKFKGFELATPNCGRYSIFKF